MLVGVSGSATSTGSFGRIDASNLTGTNTGDVTLAGSRDYITISNQVITRNQIDIGDDTNLAVGTGLNLTGDTVSVDFTDSDLGSHISGSYKGDGVFSGSVQITHDDTTGFVANEHIDHSSVSITAGSGLTGGGSITTTRALNVGQGTGITVNATNITTNDSQIVHDNLSGFVANEHIDHSGVTLSAGTGLTGGGDITTNRSFSIDFTDSDLKSHVSGSYKGDGVFSGSVQITHDDTTGFVANEHIDHTGVTITAGAGLTGGGTIASSRTINAVAGTGISVNADNITTNDSEIVHDNLSGFVANEHIDHSGVSVVAGAGLTGGGTIVSNRTINVVGGTGITANADDIATNDSEIVHDDLSGFVANEHIDHSGVSVTAGAGLTGGGTIAATRTINVVGGTGITANANDIATNDSEIVHDNLSGFVANEHIDHTSVSITAGTGLSGGGDISGTRTLAVDFTDSTFKANVTGSSTALSASLSGRITTEASNVDSLQAASASFSTRVTSNKTKLDTIETNADVTDTANVTSAGALMDSELTSISDVKALNQSVISGASPTFGTANFTDASDKRLMTDAQETKLDSVESSADVTDTANVTSAGALMDSELTSISDVKALDQSVISGASPTFGTANLTDATNKRLMTDAQETKLDSVESSADVTDTANVTSAGALMDSEVTNLSLVKGLTSGISNGNVLVANSVVADNDFLKIDGTSVEGRTAAEVRSDLGVESGATADQSDAEIRAAVEAATDSNVFTDADHTKLNAIEASADVTDTANVTAAGALMDSEVDADIKTLVLPASTTISAFGRTLIDDAAASNARTTLGLGSISTLSSIDISANTNLAASTGITLTGDTLTTNDGEIVHDDLSGFVANEHIDHSGVTLSAGTGLTGGGDITTNRSFAIDFTDSQFKANVSGSYKGDGVFSGSVQITHDDTTGFVANEHIDHTGVSIVAGAGLTGGGTIASSRTLNIGAGTGIDVAADAISVDVSDFLSNGSNDRVLTATGTDAMNAEANLIFDGTNLGIGQDTPTHMLDIYAGSLNAPGGIHLTNDDTGGGSTDGTTLFVEQNSTDFFIRNYENAGIRMRTNDTDALYINSSQNVGIGTTSPSQKLHVVGDTFIDGALTAREIYTDIVSSSIKYTSGSNKLGDSADDVHDVTGSFRVLGLASITDTTSNSTGILTITGNNAPSIKFNTPADDWLIGTHYAGSGHDFSVVNTTLSKKPFIIVNDTVGIGGDGSSNGTDPTGLGLIIDGSTATFSTTTNFGSNASTNMNIDSGDIASGVTINKSPVVNFNSGDVQGSITLTNLASGTGALTIQATSVEGSMLNDNVISGQGAMTGDVADADELMISDAGVLKRADFSVVRDAVFNDVSGDITIAAGGAATIAANSVALGTDTTGNYVSSLVAGTGIDLANNSGESATPTVSVDVSDFMSNGLNNRILTAAGADTMNAEENLTFDGSTLAIADGRSFSTSTFISGILGDGFRIDDSNNNSGSSLEIDNIVVRNTLRTHIFQKDVVKATNGILLVSDSGVISGSTGTTSTGTITVENDKSATFTSGQKAIFKEAGDDGSINFVQFTFTSNGTTSGVQSGFTKYNITANNGTLADLEPGGTFARISGGSVLIDASSPNSPFIDINYASGSTTARFGNLAGITSPRFGALGSNFGFWASGSAFLEGTINAKAGNIGTWGIGETAISSSGNNVIIDAATKRITINDGSNDRVHLGEVGSAYGLKIFDGTGTADGDRLVELGSGDNMIAGWDLKTDKIGKGPVSMSFADESFIVNAVNKNKVRMGNLNGKFGISSDQYGFILGDGSNDNSAGNVMVELSDRQNIIAGWELTPGTIQTNSTAGSVAISSTSQSFSIYTASIDYDRPKLVLGKLPLDDGTTDSPYGLAVFSGSQGEVTSGSLANASVVITKNIAKLAGWELVPGRLTSGTVAKIDGNNASIALGTNATTHTSATPQPNLFFVSASTNPVFFVGENFSFINNELKAAGWTIGSTSIAKSTDVVIDSNAKSITLGNGAVAIENNSGTPIIRSATNFTDGNGFFLSSAGTNNFRVGNNGAARLQFTGTNVEIYNSSNTKLVSLGASNTIASWTINSSTITGGSVTIDSAGIIRSATDFANGDGFFLSSASTNNFRVGDAGAARLQFTGTNTEIYNSSNQKLVSLGASNTIAGWTITTGAISKNDVKLDSTTNAEGLYVKKTSFSSTTAGGFLGLDSGTAKFNVGDASKFIKFDGSDLTVDAGNFSTRLKR